MKILSILVLSVAGLLAAASVAAHRSQMSQAAAKGLKAEGVVDANGNLRVPAGYRTSYQFLGSWAIAADKGQGSQGLHVVYASPGTIEAYRKGGHFADGSVLVKEVFQAATQPMKTGTVSHAEKLEGWFVMVKDSKNSHPGNSLWGDGWGWSWFDADKPSKTTSTNYKADCLPCHVPAQATDWVYVEGYRALAH
jgi:hypothetical protein